MIDFTLFFFASYDVREANKYELLLEAVRFADREGLKAVWTPERHFHEFGGLFPNPSVIGAALAMVTERVQIRSGSVVSPLHDEIRIAEEWSVVDNLSQGRIGLSFASGWNYHDFILKPEHYQERVDVMFSQIDTIKRLWRGESIKRLNGFKQEAECRTYPRPIQKELPIWITAAGSENTFMRAGAIGANVLTHLLGQDIDDLARKIRLYRDAWRQHGHSGEGKVALMVHTYIGDDHADVMKIVERPFIEYLKSATSLSKALYEEAGLDPNQIPEEDKYVMLRKSFERYSETSALLGTPSTCMPLVEKLVEIGVNEVACLVDFGIDRQLVLEGLKNVKVMQQMFSEATIDSK